MILCDNCSPRWSCSAYRNGDTRTECEFYQPMTNEEWFCGLSTTEKSEFMAKMVADAIKEQGECGVTRCESVLWWDEWLKEKHE